MNGTPTSLLVDTGAAVTLLRKDEWDKISRVPSTELCPWGKRQLFRFDGTQLRVYGSAEVRLTLGDTDFRSDVIMVSLNYSGN